MRLGIDGNFLRRYAARSVYYVALMATPVIGWLFGFGAGLGFYLGCVVLAGVAAYWIRRDIVLALRRRKTGLCVSCGYDLRAQRFRCPECGRWIDGAPDPGEL